MKNSLLSNRFDEGTQRDELIILGSTEQQLQHVRIPDGFGSLIWKACPVPALNQILLLIDHQVVIFSLDTLSFSLASKDTKPGKNFLSVAGTHAAWYEEEHVVVRELSNGAKLLRHPLQPQLYAGHTPQLTGAMSPDGTLLACCTQAGEVQFFDLAGGKPRLPWRGNFQMIEKLSFTPDGRWLLALEQYGSWALHCFDLASNAPLADWSALGDMSRADFAIDPNGKFVAIARRGMLEVIALASLKNVQRFPIDHMVKSCAIAWTGANTIGVRTDYGCLSLYYVG